MKYKIKIGKTVNVAAANCNCVSLPASEANEVKPLFNSLMLSSLVTNNGHRNEFQPEMKLKSATVNKPPLDIGTKILQMYSQSLAPSIIAAL